VGAAHDGEGQDVALAVTGEVAAENVARLLLEVGEALVVGRTETVAGDDVDDDVVAVVDSRVVVGLRLGW
jgi:hypothetical protein